MPLAAARPMKMIPFSAFLRASAKVAAEVTRRKPPALPPHVGGYGQN